MKFFSLTSQLALSAVVIAALAACNASTEQPKTAVNAIVNGDVAPTTAPAPAPAAKGGVDTGGGNAVDNSNQHPTMEQISEAVGQSRKIITYFLNRTFILSSEPSEQSPIDFVRSHRKEFQAVLQDVHIQLRTDKPCDDADGTSTDGSVANMPKNVVCISAFNLQSKLSVTNYQPQVQALVMHEISHWVGADEAMAQSVQRMAMEAFRSIDTRDLLHEFRVSRQALARIITQFADLSSHDPLKESLCSASINGAEEILSLDRVPNESGLQQTGYHSKAQLGYQSGTLLIDSLMACTHDKSVSKAEHDDYVTRYKYATPQAIGRIDDFDFIPELAGIEFNGSWGNMYDELSKIDLEFAQNDQTLLTKAGWQKSIANAVAQLRLVVTEMAQTSIAVFPIEVSGPPVIQPVDESKLQDRKHWPILCKTWVFDARRLTNGQIPWTTTQIESSPALVATKIWQYTKDSAPESFSEDLYIAEDGSVISMIGRYEPDPRDKTIPGTVTYRLYRDYVDGRSLPITQSLSLDLTMVGIGSVGGTYVPQNGCNLPNNF